MTCPHPRRKVTSSRPTDLEGYPTIRRACRCEDCGHRWATFELDEQHLRELVRRERERLAGKLREVIGL